MIEWGFSCLLNFSQLLSHWLYFHVLAYVHDYSSPPFQRKFSQQSLLHGSEFGIMILMIMIGVFMIVVKISLEYVIQDSKQVKSFKTTQGRIQRKFLWVLKNVGGQTTPFFKPRL